jgi:hypothetical protein
MAGIENIGKLKEKFKTRLASSLKEGKRASVCVGYCTNYALYVHEDMEARHKPGKSAKFLSRPCREHEDELADIVKRAMQTKKATLPQALLLAGERLQRESQKIVPIDTSALKASAFTCFEEDLDTISYQSFIKGVGVRSQKTFMRRIKNARKAERRRRKRKP